MFDGAFISHVLLWLIGAMTLCATVVTIGSMWAMGRTPYRKD